MIRNSKNFSLKIFFKQTSIKIRTSNFVKRKTKISKTVEEKLNYINFTIKHKECSIL